MMGNKILKAGKKKGSGHKWRVMVTANLKSSALVHLDLWFLILGLRGSSSFYSIQREREGSDWN